MTKRRYVQWLSLFVLLLIGFALAENPPSTGTYAPKRIHDSTPPTPRGQSSDGGGRDADAGHPAGREGRVLHETQSALLAKPIDAREQLKREVIGNLARMSFNEAAGARADMIGIWQVTKNIAGRAERNDLKGLRAAQRALSPRVNGVLPPRSRQHREYWTRWLRRGKEPIGWPGVQPWDEPGNGSDGATRWWGTHLNAERIYRGDLPQRVCRRAVMAWGCNADRYPHCGDPAIAEARGLERDLSCRGTLNWYYYRP